MNVVQQGLSVAQVIFFQDRRVIDHARSLKMLAPNVPDRNLLARLDDLWNHPSFAVFRQEAEAMAGQVQPSCGHEDDCEKHPDLQMACLAGTPWFKSSPVVWAEAVRNQGPLTPLLLPMYVVAGDSSMTLAAVPHVPFRGERLLLSKACAESLYIEEIRVGHISQTAGGGANVGGPGEMFAPYAFPVKLQLDTCQISQQISIRVRNMHAIGVQFLGVLLGRMVY